VSNKFSNKYHKYPPAGAGDAIVANDPDPRVQPGAIDNPFANPPGRSIHPFEVNNFVSVQGVYQGPPPQGVQQGGAPQLGEQPGAIAANDPPPQGNFAQPNQGGAADHPLGNAGADDLPLGAGNVAQPNQGGAADPPLGNAGADDLPLGDGNVVQPQLGHIELIHNAEGGAQFFDQDERETLAALCNLPPGSLIKNAGTLGHLGSQGGGLGVVFADIPRGLGGELIMNVHGACGICAFVETHFGLAAKNRITMVPIMNAFPVDVVQRAIEMRTAIGPSGTGAESSY